MFRPIPICVCSNGHNLFHNTPLEHLNLHIFDVNLLQKPSGKNMRSVLLYNPSKTSTTQWKKLGETPPTYFMSLVSLYKNLKEKIKR
jgi:hypothetical protein